MSNNDQQVRELLPTRDTVLVCYGGAGFAPELRVRARQDRIRTIGLDQMYSG